MATVGKSGSSNTINTEKLPSSRELPLNVLTSSDTTKALSAAQGKVLNDNQADETSNRQAADLSLQSSITTEASTRSSADSSLQTNIDTEASSRSSADSTLQTNINNEASTRSGADTALSSRILAIPIRIWSEIPTVTAGVDYVELANNPIAGSVKVYFNSELNTDVVIAGNKITFLEVLLADDVISVDYDIVRTS